jgi:hypothetical protein
MVRFRILTAASMKMAVLWDAAPCSLVEAYRRYRSAYCLHNQAIASEMSVNFYQATRRNIAEDSHLLVANVSEELSASTSSVEL